MSTKITRRNLIQKSGKGLIAAGTIPYFLTMDLEKAFAAQKKEIYNLTDFMNHFMVTEKLVREILGVGLSRGGDYCDLFFQHKISNYVALEDKIVNRAYSNVDFGVGIRVLKGDQTGFSFTEELTPRAMKKAAKTAANIASSKSRVKAAPIKFHKHPDYYKIKTPWEKVGIDKKIPNLKRINKKIFSLDKRVIKSSIWFGDTTSRVMTINSEGRVTIDYQPSAFIVASVTAEKKGKRENNYSKLAGRYGIEFFTPENMDRIARDAVKKTVVLFDAVKPNAGEMEVVLAAGSSGILLHEAIGHGMEADFNRKNISIFSDKIGKPVAEKFVTIVDDGTLKNSWGTLNIDDEGNDTEKTYLVENGILKSYLHDRISAKHYKVKPTGSGRRESFRFSPLPRMRNTYMLPGPHEKEEIIKSVKKGIYAEKFTNGQVHIGAGDFTFYVKSGYLIENGKLTRPIKDVNIIGNGPKVLKDIVMVGKDLEIGQTGGGCGKGGQTVPVSMGLPTIKVKKITVGGIS